MRDGKGLVRNGIYYNEDSDITLPQTSVTAGLPGKPVGTDQGGRLSALAVPVGSGEALVGALAIIWEPSEEPDDDLKARYLPLLSGLRDDILAQLT